MNKKTICIIIAVVVSICALVSTVSTLRLVFLARAYGGSLPTGMILMALVTVFCAAMIWKGVWDLKK